jgi:putative phosphonate metabolism protein
LNSAHHLTVTGISYPPPKNTPQANRQRSYILRYAIYHTPESDHPLTMAAVKWLGRDAFGRPVPELSLPAGWTQAEHERLVADPARYGFHATLKAPFSLAVHRSEAELTDAVRRFRANTQELVIPSLELRQIDGFFALVPAKAVSSVQDFAALVVRQFDEFRAPLTPAEIVRRDPERLSERQRSYLKNWGYPYVFEEFFFHMTLTGRVPPDNAGLVRGVLESHFAGFIGRPHRINHIALFVEPAPGSDFSVHSHRLIGSQPSPFQESLTHEQ